MSKDRKYSMADAGKFKPLRETVEEGRSEALKAILRQSRKAATVPRKKASIWLTGRCRLQPMKRRGFIASLVAFFAALLTPKKAKALPPAKEPVQGEGPYRTAAQHELPYDDIRAMLQHIARVSKATGATVLVADVPQRLRLGFLAVSPDPSEPSMLWTISIPNFQRSLMAWRQEGPAENEKGLTLGKAMQTRAGRVALALALSGQQA